MKPDEIHIASCVAFVRPLDVEPTRCAIEASGLGEVPVTNPAGKLVVLFERASSAEIVDAMAIIRSLPGVLAVHVVYQHAEPAAELQEAHS